MKKLFTSLFLISLALFGMAQCLPPTSSAYLDVNNVRARINLGGSSWWDQQGVAQYEVPAGSGKHSFFAGAFWIGGQDPVDVPHVAAVRFRQVGEDFWPGPLDQNGQVDSIACLNHDRIYKLNRWEVAEFRVRVNQSGYVIPQDILEWPAVGNPYALAIANAPFRDVNNDEIYNPYDGDYPAFAFDVPTNKDYHLLGDQCLWWVENDMGDMHTESNSEPLGVELRCMAYAFSTCDPLDNQTFYRYEVINKSSIDYHDTYIGLWTDTDLGFAEDDYVQCEVMRHLGFTYNGFAMDGTGSPQHYGAHPPAAGLGIFQGPFAAPNDGVDNDRDGIVDELAERNMMSRFVYHNNASGVQGDPQTGLDYYNYMRGVWIDGAPMCYGATGHPNGGCNVNVPAQFMFPAMSDPMGYGTGGVPQPLWTEQTAGNVPLDRRFMISSGPFDFDSGATEYIHYGALWARDTNDINDSFSSAQALFLAKDYCQEKFDGAFDNLDCCTPEVVIHLDQVQPNQFFFSSPEEGATYFWDFGDGTTSTERFPPQHVYSDNFIHIVTLTVTNACGTNTASMLAGTVFFGVEELELQESIVLFPNPTSGEFTVSSSINGLVIESVAVLNALGRLVYKEEVMSTHKLIQLDLSSGIYFVQLTSNKGVISKKLVVN